MADDRELVVGEVVAYRGWNLYEDYSSVRLESLGGDMWPRGGWMVAECDGHGHEVPGEDCSCGIYAARDREHLFQMGYNSRAAVQGTVALAGKVIPGSQGWRAERARPLCITVPYERWQLVRRLRETYRCEVVLGSNQLLEG